jgi:4-hydroxyphenylpyruvate dioxygenase
MRKCIATVSLSGTLEEKLAAAAQVSFDGVELFENDLIACGLSPEDVRRCAADLGLRLDLYQPFRDFEAVPPDLFAANLRRAEHKFAVMDALGIDTMLVCSSVAPAAVDDDGLAADHLHQLADLAAAHGIRIAYEALAWGRHVDDYSHAWKIVAAADHPNLGICLDSFHILSRRHDPAGIRDIPGDKIFFLQLADAPHMHLDTLQWSRHHRCFPGQGGFDLSGFLGHVLAAGYQGPLSLEVFNDVFRQADAERTATDAHRSLIALEESLGLATPPAPVEPSGYAFVELTVDPLAGIGAEQVLRAMGFRHAGRHRSKPVQLWQQGAARILLNKSHPIAGERQRAGAAVSAIAVESTDPARSAVRAQALLAPAIPRRYGPGEADLFATAAPDGTAVFFCRTGQDAASWLGDFELLDAAGGPDPTLAGIDHVALSQPAYYFEEAALFFQSVLGMRRHESEDIADPYGLVRSRAMSATGGQVRLVLNVPALGGGSLPETAAYQHIAFHCADIFGAARRLREAGAPRLAVPANYYADLAARTELRPELIELMRGHGVFYDSDGQGGEFFHFYTARLGGRMFFEIVQRVGGYDGYGTANAPVRMAAQYRQSALAGLTG